MGGHFPHFTPQKRGKFFAQIEEHGNQAAAARSIGYTIRRMYQIRAEDPVFAAEWERAKEAYADRVLEPKADERALNGSDTMLIFRLKGLKPKMYKERYEVGGDQDNPLVIETRDQRRQRIRELEAKLNGHEVEINAD